MAKLTRQELERIFETARAILVFEDMLRKVFTEFPELFADIEGRLATEFMQPSQEAPIPQEEGAPIAHYELNNTAEPVVDVQGMAFQQPYTVTITGGTVTADLTNNNASLMIKSNQTLTNGAGADLGTLTNAPSAGDPSKWVAIDDNGTTRYIPTWL